MTLTGTTMSLDEAAVLRSGGHTVTVVKKPCSIRAMFEFEDTPEARELLLRFARNYVLPFNHKKLLITVERYDKGLDRW